MTQSEPRVCVGVIIGAQGVRGEVRIKSFTANPEDIGALGPVETEDGGRRFTLKVTRGVKKDGVAASLSGVVDRDAAQALKGCKLYVARSALPQLANEEFYRADLIGLAVRWADGRQSAAEVVAVHNFGAGDLLEVALTQDAGPGAVPTPRTLLLPFNREVVPEVNLAGGFVVINPPPDFMNED